jgi:RHS repeat-associated protein
MDGETYGDGNCIAFEARIYDPRLGRFFSVDPLEFKYPSQSTYCFASNNPIALIDYLGMGSDEPVKHTVQKGQTLWGVSKEYYKNNKDKIGGTWATYWKSVQVWNKGGDYGKVGGKMILSDPEKATYGKDSEMDVTLNGKSIGTIKIVDYSTAPIEKGKESKIQMNILVGYKDNASGFSDFDWVQNVTREGWSRPNHSPTPPIQYIDPWEQHHQSPLFYQNEDRHNGVHPNLLLYPTYIATFKDDPTRMPKNFGNKNNVYEFQKFYAELTLVGKNKQGVYQPLITITYGFSTWINNGQKYSTYPIQVKTISNFQLNAILNLNKVNR